LVLFSPAKLVEAFPARGSSSLAQDCNTILETYWQQSWMSFLMLLGWFDVIMEYLISFQAKQLSNQRTLTSMGVSLVSCSGHCPFLGMNLIRF
jgi:hypothetical protein